ncbi:hypothetical protein GWC95_13705 [Sediminibacterium roseum]|uniref:Uncharacterized protein n=1 Tax=Sediminibacterium roseum TaxID=1978412 RepID=A0ABW9ZV14_9BACT|nr:DUF6526 family protein [Sediminibacterium roseum]NCI50984.1 hypothetical protein [Sediminibacterium roseum]
MKQQNYKNHVRYYPLHHFVFLPLMGFLVVLGVWKAFVDEPDRLAWILFSIVCFCILFLAIMLRQHYALGNQDRIVRLEFRLRYFELFGKNTQEIEKKLSFSQIAALRFCDDEEFKILLDRALKEGISGDEIKRSIRNWVGDYMRL